jgi:hypothetical protein
MTPLHWAANNGALETVGYLLMESANVDAETKLKEVPLHFAVRGNSQEILRMLIVHGANVNAQNVEGRTPLHIAVMEGRFECVDQLLMSPSVNLMLRDRDGVLFVLVILPLTLLMQTLRY